MKTTVLDFIKDHIYIILGVACVVAIGIVFLSSQRTPTTIIPATNGIDENEIYRNEESPDSSPTETIIFVHVAGEVNTPGMFSFVYGQRVYHAIKRAGGETAYADVHRINLAAPLRDAMQIIVPAIGDYDTQVFMYDYTPQTPSGTASAQGLVNINTASLAELQTLPLIGIARAQSIIEFREANGNFASVDELTNIHNIGIGIVDGLRDLVTVR